MKKDLYVFASVKNTKLDKGNLGDLFGYYLFEYYCKTYNINLIRLGISDNNYENNFIALVGSIIQNIDNISIKNKNISITVLGCGLIKPYIIKSNNIIYKGVRGPLTKELLNNNCEIISDPGLLISKIYPLINVLNKKKIGYIIHSVDREIFFKLFPEKKEDLIDNYTTYEVFIKKLSEYDTVISSSLHGIIFCHSYGIPVCSIKISDKIIGDNFKYIDYYHSIGNYNFKERHNITKDTNFELLIKNEWQPNKETIENFKNIQEKLIIEYINSTII